MIYFINDCTLIMRLCEISGFIAFVIVSRAVRRIFCLRGQTPHTPHRTQTGFLVGRFCFRPYTHTQKVASKTFNCLVFTLKEDFFQSN